MSIRFLGRASSKMTRTACSRVLPPLTRSFSSAITSWTPPVEWDFLTPAEILSQIIQLRRTLTAGAVIDHMASLMPLPTDLRTPVTLCLMADTVYDPDDVRRILSALEHDPFDITVWSIAVDNALRRAGPTVAHDVFRDAMLQRDMWRQALTNRVIIAIVSQPEFPLVPPAHVAVATRIYHTQLYRKSYILCEPVISALAGTIGADDRWGTIRDILEYVPMSGQRRPPNMDPKRRAMLQELYAARSHVEAVAALARTDVVGADELTQAFGDAARLRFDDAPVAPYAALDAFLAHYRAVGRRPAVAPLLAYISSVSQSLLKLQMPWERAVRERSDPASEHLRAVESLLAERHYSELLELPEVLVALLRGYTLVGDAPSATRCWQRLLQAKALAPVHRSALAAALAGVSNEAEVRAVWDEFSHVHFASHAAWSLLAQRYCQVGSVAHAFEIMRDKVGDDPVHGAAGAAALFAYADTKGALRRYVRTLPQMWGAVHVQARIDQTLRRIALNAEHGVHIIEGDFA